MHELERGNRLQLDDTVHNHKGGNEKQHQDENLKPQLCPAMQYDKKVCKRIGNEIFKCSECAASIEFRSKQHRHGHCDREPSQSQGLDSLPYKCPHQRWDGGTKDEKRNNLFNVILR